MKVIVDSLVLVVEVLVSFDQAGDAVEVDGRETVQELQSRNAELSEDSLTLLRDQLGEAEAWLEPPGSVK